MHKRWPAGATDLAAGLLLVVLPGIFYPLAAARHGVFYVGDIFRLYYPQRAVYAAALRGGTVPLWTPDILAGYPLLAEGQTGAFYPLNLLLYRLLPIDVALNYSILLGLSLAGTAMYILGRTLRLNPPAALLAGLTFAYSGFFIGHFNHLNIMSSAPWLPLELAIIEMGLGVATPACPPSTTGTSRKGLLMLGRLKSTQHERTACYVLRAACCVNQPRQGLSEKAPTDDSVPHRQRAVATSCALGAVVGIQFLAGHPQIWFMSTFVLVAFGLFRAFWPAVGPRCATAVALQRLLPIAAGIVAGVGLAAVQMLPTWELVQWSVRAGGLAPNDFSSFSWHPALISTLIVPFALGNPYPNISVELAAYLGLLSLALALVTPMLRRDRWIAFLAGLAGLSLLLAFGDNTPVYPLLAGMPVLNLFRVPARFLYPFTLSIALLAGCGLNAFLARFPLPDSQGTLTSGIDQESPSAASSETASRGIHVIGLSMQQILIAGCTIACLLLIRTLTLDTLLTLRWVLPALILALTTGLLILAWQQRLHRGTFVWAAMGLTLIDLFAFGAVFRQTYNDLMPLDEFYRRPTSLRFFPEDRYHYRTLTHEDIVPALSVLRASLYPNTSQLHGIQSANGYLPLIPARHARYLAGLTPARLNLLNVRYFLIPQLLAVTPETEYYDLHDPFKPDPVGKPMDIPPTLADGLELISFTSQSADWPQGELAAEIVLKDPAGNSLTLPVQVGLHTGEWAYDRSDVVTQIAHDRPPIARTWLSRSGFPPEDHPGHAYRAIYQFASPLEVSQVQVIPLKPAGLFHVEDLILLSQDKRHTLSQLTGLGQHRLAYRDPELVIYENADALPRAFIVNSARPVSDDAATLSLIDNPDFSPCAEVLLSSDATPVNKVGRAKDRQPDISPFPPSAPLCRPARLLSYTPQRVDIEAELDQPGYLVLLDSYYPGWRATIDDEPATVYRADFLFRAVAVGAGRHIVSFIYDPLSVKIGALISLITVACVGLAGIWFVFAGRFKHRRHP